MNIYDKMEEQQIAEEFWDQVESKQQHLKSQLTTILQSSSAPDIIKR